MKHTFIACIAGIALLAPAPGVLAAQGAEAIRHAASGGRGMQAGSKIHLRQVYDSAASSLVGMFIPDDVPADAVSEGKAFRSACDQFFEAKSNYFNNAQEIEAENLKKKEELIERLKNHAFGADRNENLEAIKAYQREWTEIGFVPKKEKERI